MARGFGNFFSRSHWGKDAVWTVVQCTKTIDIDHFHPNAGNVVMSRGADDLIVDPSPYGTLSSLTSNAPTVESEQLPPDYKPSQAFWSLKTGFRWAHQTASGVTVARCDYADQYKFQDNPSDVPAALRDVIVFPWDKGANATMIVVDRAKSGAAARGLHLRFRTQAKLTADGTGASGPRGTSQIAIRQAYTSGGTGKVRSLGRGDCFSGATRGGCDIPRFDIDQWELVVPGPTMDTAHVLDATGARSKEAPATVDKQGGISVITAARAGASFTVAVGGSDKLTYRAPAGTHVVLDGPNDAMVSATTDKSGCAVTVAASGGGTKISGRPAIFTLDTTCAVSADALQAKPLASPTPGGPVDAGSEGIAAAAEDAGGSAGGASGEDGSIVTPNGTLPRSARSGCCGAQAAPGPSFLMAALVLGWCLLRRRRLA